jgi:hypothetical protein
MDMSDQLQAPAPFVLKETPGQDVVAKRNDVTYYWEDKH